MDQLDFTRLPDLSEATAIEAKDMRFKKYAHIEYFTQTDGKIVRVCRPWGDWPIFFIPLPHSLNAEYLRDMEILKREQRSNWPDYQEIDGADATNDNIWCNQTCFNNVKSDE